uniref:Transcriptional coactivator p15 (PC4) C-terminal domain-containing protein n=1 Tax=Acrobeloides nanus TaxID=290746 RepID=A0A914CQ03_9BILA
MSTDSDTSFEEVSKKPDKSSKTADKKDTSKKRVRDDDDEEEEKTTAKSAPSKKSKYQKNDEGAEMIPIGRDRFVTVREFKGKALVDIREFYEDKKDGKLKPGRKGISLSREQYIDLKGIMGEIDARLNDI